MDFETVFDGVYPALFRYCQRLTGDADAAEDVAQEAFIRFIERGVEGELRGVRVWLFKVATHLIRDRARTTDNRRRLLTANPVVPSGGLRPDQVAERNERIQEVRRVLDTLTPRDKEMLLMREEGFSYREVADAVGVAHTSVGTLLVRAQTRFAEAYQTMTEADETSG